MAGEMEPGPTRAGPLLQMMLDPLLATSHTAFPAPFATSAVRSTVPTLNCDECAAGLNHLSHTRGRDAHTQPPLLCATRHAQPILRVVNAPIRGRGYVLKAQPSDPALYSTTVDPGSINLQSR